MHVVYILKIFFHIENHSKSEEFRRKIFFQDYLSVSESVSVHEIQDLSADRTCTVRVFGNTKLHAHCTIFNIYIQHCGLFFGY